MKTTEMKREEKVDERRIESARRNVRIRQCIVNADCSAGEVYSMNHVLSGVRVRTHISGHAHCRGF